jgi:Flp pilus assembly protein TadD
VGTGQTVRVWDAACGQELLTLKGHTGRVHGLTLVMSLAYSPDGRRLATAGNDLLVRIWDTATGQELLSLKGHTGLVSGVAYSPDGQRLASWSNYEATVRIWDALSGQALLTLKGHKGMVFSVAYSPDSRRLASVGSDYTIRAWDAASGQQLLTLKGWGERVTYSPDGRRVAAVAGLDRTVRIWDAASGQELLTLKGHTDLVSDVSYSPDGRRLASASQDGTVRIWDAASGQELLTLRGPTSFVQSVAFSPDGRRLAMAGGVGWVWEASPVPVELWRQRGLVSDVDSLFDKLLVREEVMAALRTDATLSKADRDFGLRVAHAHAEEPARLNDAAWQVVRAPGASKDAYALALCRAEAAVRAAPGDGNILNTLGVAQYRAGRFAEALVTLTKSDKLNATKDGPHRADLAFLAMAQHRLGKKDEAKATLGRLREVMKERAQANDAEAQGFLREAEELIEEKPAAKKP